MLTGKHYIVVPSATTTQRLALTTISGMLVYDTTLNAFYKYENGSWSGFAGGGGGAVNSVFGRSGNVVATSGDYTTDQVTETASKVFVAPTEKTAIAHTNRTILDAIQEALTTTLKNAYDSAVSWISTNGTNLINHLSNTSNPHNTTAEQVGAPRILYADNNTYLITGGTGEVIGVSRLIPANTLSADKSLEVRCRVLRVSGTAGVITPRIRFSTSATPSPVNSATQIANGVHMATGNFWQQMKRTFVRKTSTSLEVFNATIQLADDDVQTTAAASTVTFDTTVDQWLHFTIQNSNATDTSAISHISIILI